MNLDRFSGPGSTPSRRKFWDKVQSAVMASRKVAGRNVTIDEHSGAGSVINAPDRSRTPPGDCGPTHPTTLDFSFTSPVWTPSQTGLPVRNPSGACSGLGWLGASWATTCSTDNVCGKFDKYCVGLDDVTHCLCGIRLDWVEVPVGSDVARIRIILNKLQGVPSPPPWYEGDGWYLWANAQWTSSDFETVCTWETFYCTTFPCQCVYLGADDSIFDTDLEIDTLLYPDVTDPEDERCGTSGVGLPFILTFHP